MKSILLKNIILDSQLRDIYIKGNIITKIGNNLNFEVDEIFGDNYIQLANNKYIDKKYLLNKPKEKITKKENYLVDSKYVNKYNKNIIDSRYVTLFIPKKICTEKIKIVEIVFENNIVKICFLVK
jgi:hypothetical protein